MMRGSMVAGAIGAALLFSANGASAQVFTGARAESYPWCARYSSGGSNCGFVSYQQCRATVRGIGGQCVQNRWFAAVPSSRAYAGPVYAPAYRPPVHAAPAPVHGPAFGLHVGPRHSGFYAGSWY